MCLIKITSFGLHVPTLPFRLHKIPTLDCISQCKDFNHVILKTARYLKNVDKIKQVYDNHQLTVKSKSCYYNYDYIVP